MGVNVKVIGENNYTDEYSASKKLEDIFIHTIPKQASGEIVIYPSATLFGQSTKDIDILVIGYLDDCTIPLKVTKETNRSVEQVSVYGFCTVVEIKGHDSRGIRRTGTDWYVKYGERWHNVTEQSNNQKISTMNYFQTSLGISPYISNVIWFTELSINEYSKLATYNNKIITTNVLSNEFSFYDFAQLLIDQQNPKKTNGKYKYNSGVDSKDIETYIKALDFFKTTIETMGELTRSKIELITNKALQKISVNDNKEFTILRGRAGTGKTIELIRHAIKLVEDDQKRVLILTYNNALVSDIRRLFSLANLPDMFSQECVSIMTIHSYLYSLINKTLFDSKLKSNVFIENYDYYLQQMTDFLAGSDSVEIISDICNTDIELNWEYLLIDEGQDWNQHEMDIVLKLFDNKKIIVADGGQQFVRRGSTCDWNAVHEKNTIKFKYCLRQKNNLIRFLNKYNEQYGTVSNRIIGSEKMTGGKIHIITNKNNMYECIISELNNLKLSGNVAYDFLLLVPFGYVKSEFGYRRFKLLEEFNEKGINLWDGTSINGRTDFPINPNQSRVLQYESSRGLEGWTVCLLDFDKWLEEKEKQFDNSVENNTLLLESDEDKINKYMLNWSMMPLTRAIDTLIIVLDDEKSKYSQKLIKIAEELKDYIDLL